MKTRHQGGDPSNGKGVELLELPLSPLIEKRPKGKPGEWIHNLLNTAKQILWQSLLGEDLWVMMLLSAYFCPLNGTRWGNVCTHYLSAQSFPCVYAILVHKHKAHTRDLCLNSEPWCQLGKRAQPDMRHLHLCSLLRRRRTRHHHLMWMF